MTFADGRPLGILQMKFTDVRKEFCRVTWKPAAVCRAAFAYKCICIRLQCAFRPAEAAENLTLPQFPFKLFCVSSLSVNPTEREKHILLFSLLQPNRQFCIIVSLRSSNQNANACRGKLVSKSSEKKSQIIQKLHHSFLNFRIRRSKRCYACRS